MYIAFGYMYLTAYYWISFKDNKDFHNIIFKSLIANYVLVTIYQMISYKCGIIILPHTPSQVIIYSIVSVTLGLVVGRIVVSTRFNTLLARLHFGRTVNDNIWNDIVDDTRLTWLCIHMTDGTAYLGQYYHGELFTSEPVIMLVTYQKLDDEGNVLNDYSQDKDRAIVLNTKDFDRIEVVYQDRVTKKK